MLGSGGPKLPVRFVYYDDASDGPRCAELTQRLMVENGVDILMGPYSSGLSVRAATVAQRYGRILWNQGGASESIYTSGSKWVVGILTPSGMYFHGVLELVRQRYPRAGKVAIVHSTAGAFPRDVASGAVQHSQTLGFDTVCVRSYSTGTTDFGRILSRIKRDRPDVVLEVGRIEDDIRFAQQLVESGLSVPVVALIVTPLALFKDALGEGVEGFMGPSQWEPDVVVTPDFGPSSKDVVRSLMAKGQPTIDYPMAQAYAGCLVAQRCSQAGRQSDGLHHVLRSLPYRSRHGPSGGPPDACGAVGAWREGRRLASRRGGRPGKAGIGPVTCAPCGPGPFDNDGEPVE